MDRWFCSNHFIPSFKSILPLILMTFPLPNLWHSISPCAEANAAIVAPARGASHAARGAAQCRIRVSWKGLDLLRLFLNLSMPRQAVVSVLSVSPAADRPVPARSTAQRGLNALVQESGSGPTAGAAGA